MYHRNHSHTGRFNKKKKKKTVDQKMNKKSIIALILLVVFFSAAIIIAEATKPEIVSSACWVENGRATFSTTFSDDTYTKTPTFHNQCPE